jgi:hypothetical protein
LKLLKVIEYSLPVGLGLGCVVAVQQAAAHLATPVAGFISTEDDHKTKARAARARERELALARTAKRANGFSSAKRKLAKTQASDGAPPNRRRKKY